MGMFFNFTKSKKHREYNRARNGTFASKPQQFTKHTVVIKQGNRVIDSFTRNTNHFVTVGGNH